MSFDPADLNGNKEPEQEYRGQGAVNNTGFEKINKTQTKVPVYDLLSDYSLKDSTQDQGYIQISPDWVLAVYRLGQPVTYSRVDQASFFTDVVSGAFDRAEGPLIIHSDCIDLTISRNKRSHTKSLNAKLKGTVNYLSANNILPGDWVLAWMCNNSDDIQTAIENIRAGQLANSFHSGLKFIGRAHSIRKAVSVDLSGNKNTYYSLQGVGFEELDTTLFYNINIATQAYKSGNLALFMAQLGLDCSKFFYSNAKGAGAIEDNLPQILEFMVDVIVGKGIDYDKANAPTDRAQHNSKGSHKGVKNNKVVDSGPQISLVPPLKESPYAYIIPVSVGKTLGLEIYEKNSKGVFGYSDILETVIGVQQYGGYKDGADIVEKMYPVLNLDQSHGNRKRCAVGLKGTFLPVEGSFTNIPLWDIFQQFLNPAINEMYTCLKPAFSDGLGNGCILPTIVVRQIPFSTESIQEEPDFPLTRFLRMPRWRVDPLMVKAVDVGRSNATRFNMAWVLFNSAASAVKGQQAPAAQMVKKPPIFDTLDIARSGIRVWQKTVNCALKDTQRPNSAWLSAIADWTFGSHLTLNGTLQCVGIQTPIAEGDNVEFEGIAYQIEGIEDRCSINIQGIKTYTTSLQLTNGMPVDQKTDYSIQFPRYAGFGKSYGKPTTTEVSTTTTQIVDTGKVIGYVYGIPYTTDLVTATNTVSQVDNRGNLQSDDLALTSQDPGRTKE